MTRKSRILEGIRKGYKTTPSIREYLEANGISDLSRSLSSDMQGLRVDGIIHAIGITKDKRNQVINIWEII